MTAKPPVQPFLPCERTAAELLAGESRSATVRRVNPLLREHLRATAAMMRNGGVVLDRPSDVAILIAGWRLTNPRQLALEPIEPEAPAVDEDAGTAEAAKGAKGAK